MPNREGREAGTLLGGTDQNTVEKEAVSPISECMAPTDECRQLRYIRDEDLPAPWIYKIRKHVNLIIRDPSAVDDVMQDLRTSLIRQTRKDWDAIESKEGYIWQSARNAAYGWLRKKRAWTSNHTNFMWHEQHKTEGELQDLSGPARALDDFVRMLQPLGDRCAEAYVRVRYWGDSHQETAAVMNITVGGVKKHLERADRHFQNLLEQEKASSPGSRFMKFFRRGE